MPPNDSTRDAAALRDFRSVNVCFGSSATEAVAGRRRSTSASPRKRT